MNFGKMKIHSKTKSQMENKDLFYGNLSYIQNIEAKGLIPAYNPIIKKFTSDNYIFPDDSTSIREIEYLKTQITPDILENKNKKINIPRLSVIEKRYRTVLL